MLIWLAFSWMAWAISYGLARVIPEGKLKSVLYKHRQFINPNPPRWQRYTAWTIMITIAALIIRANYWR